MDALISAAGRRKGGLCVKVRAGGLAAECASPTLFVISVVDKKQTATPPSALQMKAVTPLPPSPQSRKTPSSALGCGELALRCLRSDPSLSLGGGRMQPPPAECGAGPAEEPPSATATLCLLQYDMDDCYSRLRRLVPTIPQHRRVSKVEILQHVIDYILDLQLALDTHPALQLRPPAPARTPLADLNADPTASVVKKQGDSILCR